MATKFLGRQLQHGNNEEHPARLLFIEELGKNNEGQGSRISISLEMDGQPKIEFIPPNEPSTIFKNLPIAKPNSLSNIESPPYYPSYTNLLPEQRWIYLNWLKDITQEIDIGYVFLYYYGLERHLLVGDFETAFSEVLLLRKYHTNKSFELYSYNALMSASVYHNLVEKVQYLSKFESMNGIDNIDLLYKFRFLESINAEEMMSLSRRIKGVNTRYIKSAPDQYKAALIRILLDIFGVKEYPFFSRLEINDIPKLQIIAFANISFPSSIRTPAIPNFCEYHPFVEECLCIFSKVHKLVKIDIKKLTHK